MKEGFFLRNVKNLENDKNVKSKSKKNSHQLFLKCVELLLTCGHNNFRTNIFTMCMIFSIFKNSLFQISILT